MKIQCTMAVLPKDNVKVSVYGNYLQVAYDFVRIEQKEEDASESMHMVVENSCLGEYIELRGGIRSYDAIASAIIEDKYPSDKMDAIRFNFELAQNSDVASISLADSQREEYIAEDKSRQGWRIHAKDIAATSLF